MLMAVVNPLSKEHAAADVQAVYDNLRQAFGRMPNIFAVMAHRPGVLNTFLPLYTAIINEGTVTPKYKELAWVKTSHVNGCAYWSRAHTASAKQAGITDAQLHALPFSQSSQGFDAQEQAVLAYADSVTRGASAVREETLQELRKYFSEDQIVELTLVICMANFTNRFNEALKITPDLGWVCRYGGGTSPTLQGIHP
jgi:uncharacterized peroxidase-related enzyme